MLVFFASINPELASSDFSVAQFAPSPRLVGEPSVSHFWTKPPMSVSENGVPLNPLVYHHFPN
jgi:hypothetical protein